MKNKYTDFYGFNGMNHGCKHGLEDRIYPGIAEEHWKFLEKMLVLHNVEQSVIKLCAETFISNFDAGTMRGTLERIEGGLL